MNLVRAFKDHPASVGETYAEHLFAALGFASTMARAAFCCAVHAFLPFLFTRTGSQAIAELSDRMRRGSGSPAVRGERQTISQH